MAEMEATSLRVEGGLLAIAQKLADESGTSRAEVLRSALEDGLALRCEKRNNMHVFLATEAKRRNTWEAATGGNAPEED